MKYRQIQAAYYCGADMHARSTYICILDPAGHTLLQGNLPNNFDKFKQTITPFLPHVAVGVESTYNYYWLADGCKEAGIPFYLGHALYMKAISGHKNKNDRLDAQTIANLLRTNYFPEAYPYPKQMRATRDLLRRRHRLVRLRAEAFGHIQLVCHQHEVLDVNTLLVKDRHHRGELISRFEQADTRKNIETDIALIESLDPLIAELEVQIRSQARYHNRRDFNSLMTIPGVGEILAFVILYETHDISRFGSVQEYSSYCRVVKCQRTSAGKAKGDAYLKMGNPYLKWAYGQIILSAQRHSEAIGKYYQRFVSKYGKGRAKSIMGHKFAIAVYYMLKNGQSFDEKRFIQEGG